MNAGLGVLGNGDLKFGTLLLAQRHLGAEVLAGSGTGNLLGNVGESSHLGAHAWRVEDHLFGVGEISPFDFEGGRGPSLHSGGPYAGDARRYRRPLSAQMRCKGNPPCKG